ncbi:MAG: UDP-N-acetylglucosamine--N-acetylmuramyl-(pentapeptide) pyrophosphoryl-undecaprenol N-acetylglucosamine transferase [Patescibacteria group bacterium]
MKILFTGGATGGHFYPLIAIAKALREIVRKEKILDPEFYFMGPNPYDERLLFENNITFLRAPAGKIRRYFSLANITDGIKTSIGMIRAIFTVFFMYPDVVVGKGGYGSFPALFAAKLFKIPVIIHESDSKPGRVNSWAGKFAKRIAISYPQTSQYFPPEKTALTGCPIRDDVAKPILEGGYEFLKLEKGVPIILILGGSQGARTMNDTILDTLFTLVQSFQIIHQTGQDHFKEVTGTAQVILEKSEHKNRYLPLPYLNVLALRMAAGVSSLVISRAGSTIFEIAAWGLPSIIVPIPQEVSHDQMGNAFAYARSGAATVIEQKNLSPSILEHEIRKIVEHQEISEAMRKAAQSFSSEAAAKTIAQEIYAIATTHE